MLREMIISLHPQEANFDINKSGLFFLTWPPNLFALTSKFLSATGIYHYHVSPPPGKEVPPVIFDFDWKGMTRAIAMQWRQKINEDTNVFDSNVPFPETAPKHLVEIWDSLLSLLNKYSDSELFRTLLDVDDQNTFFAEDHYQDDWKAYTFLMALHAIADAVCFGWGIRCFDFKGNETIYSKSKNDSIKYLELDLNNCAENSTKSNAQKYAESLLKEKGTLATISPSKCRILPKRHTPAVGVTLRSMSESLGYHRSSVEVAWHDYSATETNELTQRLNAGDENKKKLNNKAFSVLLLPWPLKVSSKDFKVIHPEEINFNDKYSGFFTYTRFQEDEDKYDNISSFRNDLDGCIKNAKKEAPTIDMVILPEGYLNSEMHVVLKEVLGKHKIPTYIAGFSEKQENSELYCNKVYFDVAKSENNSFAFASESETKPNHFQQEKHHRWKLTKNQIVNYNIGHVLQPEKSWWEGISIGRRKVNFINISHKITVCPLICEDLARQDPIADLIRTVGPSLVVTILMDGPQTLNRWPARYASVLAEDPGCSVITLTSFGMIKKSRKSNNVHLSSIALFCDGNGNYYEIEMEENSSGVLLNLYIHPKMELLSDGRNEHNEVFSLLMGGVHQIKNEQLSCSA